MWNEDREYEARQEAYEDYEDHTFNVVVKVIRNKGDEPIYMSGVMRGVLDNNHFDGDLDENNVELDYDDLDKIQDDYNDTEIGEDEKPYDLQECYHYEITIDGIAS